MTICSYTSKHETDDQQQRCKAQGAKKKPVVRDWRESLFVLFVFSFFLIFSLPPPQKKILLRNQGEGGKATPAATHANSLKANSEWKYESENFPEQDLFVQSLKPVGGASIKPHGQSTLLSLESVHNFVTGMAREPADESVRKQSGNSRIYIK